MVTKRSHMVTTLYHNFVLVCVCRDSNPRIGDVLMTTAPFFKVTYNVALHLVT